MSWPAHTIHFIDFEGSVTSGILEYGVVTLRGGEIVDTATRLCRATGRVREEDAAVHGIEAAAVASHDPFTAEFELFASLRESGPLAAHFASAENTMIKSVWAYPRQSPDFVRPGEAVADWGPWIDTGRLYPQLYTGLESARLEVLVGRCGLQNELDRVALNVCPPDRRRYHAALYDALAGALLLRRMAMEPEVAAQSLPWLLSMSTLDPVKREAMTQGDLF
ncbi:3'-5' exonuclease [Synoicihabitans lomoniglobus]|uniref:3'-5' exonuclease n=1 Tax=Synoicihabitans lomoniglobus TaxID=2909285 RepID=A0AAF0CNY6_9BACT|nr:3'-5' exonuclease [Opitutaceae bacterium LMO-M01]WED65271.1 3'-5' exonuclease [Opitutaceae bacterium LMO-M01]